MAKRSVLADIRDAFGSELDAGQQSALISWLAFTATFSGVRGITHAIRAGKGPFKNLSVGGEHLHHYMWGIGLLAGVGAVAVKGDEKLRRHPATALAYGGGLRSSLTSSRCCSTSRTSTGPRRAGSPWTSRSRAARLPGPTSPGCR